MADIDTYLFANGQLRLSIHGAKRGGNVLVYEHDGRTSQCEITDYAVVPLSRRLAESTEPASKLFANIAAYIAIPGTVRV